MVMYSDGWISGSPRKDKLKCVIRNKMCTIIIIIIINNKIAIHLNYLFQLSLLYLHTKNILLSLDICVSTVNTIFYVF